jgi:hypothetical protein
MPSVFSVLLLPPTTIGAIVIIAAAAVGYCCGNQEEINRKTAANVGSCKNLIRSRPI